MSRSGAPRARFVPAFLAALAAMTALAGLAGCRSRSGEAPSVLLVTLDTVRADRLGAYGAAAGATPNLDRLASRGVVFERAYSVAPLTLPAHATMLTGLLPPRTGLRWNGEQRLDAALPTIAERFRAAGYATGAFVSAAVLDAAFGLDRGFDRYDDEVESGAKLEAERAGAATVARALAWLDAQPARKPLFAWVHLFDPHDPYRAPEPFAGRFADPYDAEIAAADAALAPLLDHRRFAAGSPSIVAVVGDHGESLGEQGEATHGVLVHEAVLRVPLLLAVPGLSPSRFAGEVGQADLAPTLLALTGLPALEDGDGVALVIDLEVDVPRSRTLYAESLYGEHVYGWAPLRAARRDGWKLVRGAGERLFDLATDAREVVDRSHDAGLASDRLPILRRALDDAAARERTGGEAQVDEALRARLSSLGYVTGAAPGDAAAPAPGSPDPYDRIAVHEKFRAIDAQLERGDVAGARQGIREILALDPANRLARLAAATAAAPLGDLLRAAGEALAARRFDDAERLAREAVALDPGSAAARNARAIALEELGRRGEAEREYEAALAADPGYVRAELNLALLREARGGPADLAAARAGLERVLARSPREPLALWTLGRLLLAGGDRVRAATLLRELVAVAPGHPKAAEARTLLASLGGA